MSISDIPGEPILSGRNAAANAGSPHNRCLRQLFAAILAGLCLTGLPTPVLAGEFPAELELSALDGSNGFALDGTRLNKSGSSVSGAGEG